MKIDVLLVGTKGLTYESKVLLDVLVDGELFAVHEGHNKLMHIIVVSHFKTGIPIGMSRVNPETAIDEKIAQKYADFFNQKMRDFVPGDRKAINNLPDESA